MLATKILSFKQGALPKSDAIGYSVSPSEIIRGNMTARKPVQL
jgi:hypothetical protein